MESLNKQLRKMQENNEPGVFRVKAGKLAGFLGLFSNLFLGLLKVFLGLFTHSVSITADAINNLTDSASSLLTLVGFVVAEKPADKEHPYGHERFESISGLFICVLVIFVGLQFLKTSVERIITPAPIKTSPLIFFLLLFSIGVKFWQSRSYEKIGQFIQSDTLKASSQDSLNDCLTTGVVLISSIVQSYFGLTIDGFVGLFVAGYILFSGIQMLMNFVGSLLGEIPAEEKIKKMEDLLENQTDILGFHDLMFHSYGANHEFATVHIEISDTYSLEEAHEIIDHIEKDFLEELNIQLVCHVDPVALKNPRRQKIRKSLRKFVRYLEEDLTLHDLRLHEGEEEVLSFDIVVPKAVRFSDEELLQRLEKYCLDEFQIKKIKVVFDHNYLLQK